MGKGGEQYYEDKPDGFKLSRWVDRIRGPLYVVAGNAICRLAEVIPEFNTEIGPFHLKNILFTATAGALLGALYKSPPTDFRVILNDDVISEIVPITSNEANRLRLGDNVESYSGDQKIY